MNKLFNLLNDAFNDGDLQTFCFKYFGEVHNNFGEGQDKAVKICNLIDHCRKHDQLNLLYEKIKEERPKMYAKYETRLPKDISGISSQKPLNQTSNVVSKYLDNIPSINFNEVIGREENLEDLKTNLDARNNPVVIQGMGGIGKSTLAKAFINRYQNDYKHLLWIDGKNGIREGFSNNPTLVHNLNLKDYIESSSPDINSERVLELILNKLKNLNTNPDQHNLLIVDDAQNDIEIYAEKISLQPYWKVLLTSRNKLIGFEEYKLDFLSEENAIDLFLLYYHKEDRDQKEIIRQIINIVGLHTLTIELLAKTAQSNRDLSLNILKDRLNEKGLNLAEAVKVKTTYDKVKVETYIFKCLETAFDLAELTQDNFAIDILIQFSVIPTNYISYPTLKELLQIDFDKLTTFNEKLNELRDKGWISENEQGFKMHEVVQDVLRYKLQPDFIKCEKLIRSIRDKIEPISQEDNFLEQLKWIEYAQKIDDHITEKNDLMAEIHAYLAKLYHTTNDIDRAIKLREKTLEYLSPKCLDLLPFLSSTMAGLGMNYQMKGFLQKALALFENSLQIDQMIFGDKHVKILRRWIDIASIHHTLGDFDQAIVILEGERKRFECILEEDQHDLFILKQNLGACYLDKGQTEDAKGLLIPLYNSIDKYKDTPLIIIHTQENMGRLYILLEEFTLAKEYLEASKQLHIDTYGLDSYINSNGEFCFMSLYMEQGLYQEVIDNLRDNLITYCQNLGQQSLRAQNIKSKLIEVYMKLGRDEEAEILLNEI
ncbi:MAG: tetratricopeptide repeat protein [Microscillaceae bacterium]|nr:tetratricopeptide repeat protein [Microscillaceae bacterium]